MITELKIYRGNDVEILSLPIDAETKFAGQINQGRSITCPVLSPLELDVQYKDYIIHKGEKYAVNSVPAWEYDGVNYKNVFKFDDQVENLKHEFIKFQGAEKFPYFSNTAGHVALLVASLNEDEPGYTVGTIEEGGEKLLEYSWHKHLDALIMIAEAYGLEFSLNGKQINLVKTVGKETGLVFEVGMHKGLYNLKLQGADNKNVVTRMYGIGGSKNIDHTYRNGIGELRFEEMYLESNVDKYGVRAEKYINEDIFPKRTAQLTGIGATGSTYAVVDTTIDFNIMAYLQEGLKAKILFKSGALMNQEFDIHNYDHSTKTIYFIPSNDNGYVLPNPDSLPEIGDKYTLVDILMPPSYKVAAEAELKVRTLEALLQNNVPQVLYTLDNDEKFIRDNGIELELGDHVSAIGKGGVMEQLRITGLTYPLVNEADVDAIISNFVPYSMQDRITANIVESKRQFATISQKRAELARRNALNLFALKDLIIDPEGNYYTEKIKPHSIETLYFSNGAKATYFALKGVSFSANVGGDPSKFTATPGQLVHFALKIEGVGFVWNMVPFLATDLVASTAYYLYARVSRTTLAGSWVLSTEEKTAESEPGYFTLQTGVLFPVVDGFRNHEITKGMTFIIGDQITAGVLKSVDGLNFFNMNNSTFNLGEDSGADYGVSTPGKFTVRAGFVQNAGGVSAPMPVFRGAYYHLTTYYNGDTVTYNGSTWAYIYPTPIFNVTPAEGAYWTVVAAKGADGINGLNGADGTPGPAGTNGQTSYFHVAYADAPDGSVNFNQSGGKYIGTYVDYTAADSTNPASYNWVLLKGADGANGTNGIPGVNGADGQTSYLHIKYSDDGGATFTASNGEVAGQFLGQYVDFNLADSNDPAAYTWAKIKGSDGLNGADGAAGNSTEFRFAKNGSPTVAPGLVTNDPDPAGWTVVQPTIGVAEYAWITSAVKTSAGALVGSWSPPTRFTGVKGENGADGAAGANGAQGPFLNYRGDFDPGKTYIGSTTNIQGVNYLGNYYVTRIDAGSIAPGTLPTDASKWNPFGGQFESVATGLLLATLAYIENLGVRHLATDNTGAKRIVINGVDNNFSFFNSDNELLMKIDDDSVIEYITPRPYPEPPEVHWGPGFAVGLLGENGVIIDPVGFSSMGRTGFYTSQKLEVGDKTTLNGETTVDDKLIVTGDTDLQNLSISGSVTVDGVATFTGIAAYRNGNGETKGMRFINGQCVQVERPI